jgi:hypothetical protein
MWRTARSRGHLALLAILVGAAVLRFWGLQQGLPNPNARPDERELLMHTAGFTAGDWNPKWFVYPNLFFYIVFAWEQVCLTLRRLWLPTPSYAEMLRTALPSLILYGRVLSALVGTATVALCFAIGRRLGGPALGLVASLLLATNYLHVRDSHMLKNEILLPAGVLVTLWMLAAWVARPTLARAFAAGVSMGVATALMYTGVLLAVPAWLSGALVTGRRGIRRLQPHPHVLIMLVVAATTVLLACPYLLLDLRGVSNETAIMSRVIYGSAPGEHAETGAAWLERVTTFVEHRAFGYHLVVSLRHGFGLVMAVVIPFALAFAWRRSGRPLLALGAVYCVVTYLVIGSSRVHFARFVTPLAPVLALLVADLVLAASERVAPRPGLRTSFLALMVLLLVAEPLASAVAYDRIAAQTDTRVLAQRWMQEHLPRNALVAEIGSRVFPMREVELPPGVNGVFAPPVADDLAREGVTHVLVRTHHLVFSQPDADQLRALDPSLRLLVEFSPYVGAPAGYFEPEDAYYVPFADFDGVVRPGPLVRIYAYEPPR